MKRKIQIYIVLFAFFLAAGFASDSTGVMAFGAAEEQGQETESDAASEGQETESGAASGNQGQETESDAETEGQETESGAASGNQGQETESGITAGNQGNTETSQNKEKKRGWVTLENGAKKYFDKNGKYVTGFKKIGGKTYSFNAHGRLQINCWVKYKGNKYRTNKKGELIKEKAVTIDGSKYYFGKNGVLVRGKTVTLNKKVYYFGKNGALVRNKAVTLNNNTYYFGSNGALVKDKLVTINKHVYYFGSNGAMYKGWKKEKNGMSYFKSNGVRASGLTQIDGKYYYFDSNGLMKTGTFQEGENTYYMSEDGVLEVWKTKSEYYDSGNRKMTKIQAEDFETFQSAKKIAAEITNSGMSQAQKLRKCFDWVKAKPYMTRRKFNNAPGWPALYANDHFIYGSGNCQSDAAAFAYLAKAIGYTNVYVCADSTGWGLPHSWTEINGLVYDPLFAEAKGFSQNYGVRYGVYKLWPVVHIKL